MKSVVISVLLLGIFLMMANIAPSLLSDPHGRNKDDPRRLTSNQMRQSITTLIVLFVGLVLALHYWR